MGMLQDTVGRFSSDFTQNVSATKNNIKTGINDFVKSNVNSVVNTAKGIESGLINNAVSSVSQAGKDLLTGNFANIGSDLSQIGSGSLNVISSGISGLLGGGGSSMTVTSSDNGVSEGNALYGILNRSDPMININWYALMPVINSQMGSLGLAWYYVEEGTLPFRNLQPYEIFKDGRPTKYPGRYAVDDLTLNIYLDQANVALNYLNGWNSAIVLPTNAQTRATQGGERGRPSTFRKSIYIYLLDNSRNAIDVIEYTEAWPSVINSLSVGSGTTERLIANVTFPVGDIQITNYQTTASITNQILNAINPAASIQELVSSVGGQAIKTVENAVAPTIKSASDAVSNFVSGFF